MSAPPVPPEIERVRRQGRRLYSPAQVRAALGAMAKRVAAELAGSNPIVVAVMHGGAFTAVHLCEQLDFPHEFDYVHVGRYGKSLRGGEVEWIVGPKASYRDRVVLVVDDVLDRGTTLAAVQAELERIRVAKLKTAVLVSKACADPATRPPIDYVGLDAPDEYLFGCGMDYKGYWRNLPALYSVGTSFARDSDER